MSLNRVSYLESWEQNPAAFRRQPRPEDSEDEDGYHDLPETSLSSSFQSNISRRSFRQRLNFNPYAGPGWSEVSGEETDRHPLLRAASPRRSRADEVETEQPPESHVALKAQDYESLETTGAFEVERTKRICGLPLQPPAAGFLQPEAVLTFVKCRCVSQSYIAFSLRG